MGSVPMFPGTCLTLYGGAGSPMIGPDACAVLLRDVRGETGYGHPGAD
jgi:hypothetical protein